MSAMTLSHLICCSELKNHIDSSANSNPQQTLLPKASQEMQMAGVKPNEVTLGALEARLCHKLQQEVQRKHYKFQQEGMPESFNILRISPSCIKSTL
uniref:Uncharacterized protein n=1 Tax=Solanum lycopersicum TaxID=4081 RepID=A0A3Q7EE85_SOLLC